MKFLKKLAEAKLTVVPDEPQDGEPAAIPQHEQEMSKVFLRFMELFIDHKPSPKLFAQILLRTFQADNEHGNHHLQLHSYAKAEFAAVATFLQKVVREAEVLWNKDSANRKKKAK